MVTIDRGRNLVVVSRLIPERKSPTALVSELQDVAVDVPVTHIECVARNLLRVYILPGAVRDGLVDRDGALGVRTGGGRCLGGFLVEQFRLDADLEILAANAQSIRPANTIGVRRGPLVRHWEAAGQDIGLAGSPLTRSVATGDIQALWCF